MELDLTPDALNERTTALRALARGLLGDVHEAEDVAQEAWLAALRARDPLHHPVAWMAGTTRRLVAKTIRGRQRTRQREQVVARPERMPSAAQLAEEAEVLRTVADAVAGLDEPYKTTLLLRYYHDRTPREIAAAQGVPVATAKTRLRRGLHALRARLDERHGGRAWIAPLAAFALAGPAFAVSVKTKAVIGLAAALLLVGWIGFSGRAAPQPPHAAPAIAGRVKKATPTENTNADAEPSATEAPASSILVLDPEGEPVPDARVTLEPFGRWNEATKRRTDARGRVPLDADFQGNYEVRASSNDYAQVGRFVELPRNITLRLRRGCRLKLRLNPWPAEGWADYKWSVQGDVYRATELSFDKGEIDTGVWPAGVVTIYRSPPRGGRLRSVPIALPDGGEVVHELKLPPSRGPTAEITVEDAETGAVIHDWRAWNMHDVRVVERRQASRHGTYHLPVQDGVVITAPGFARAYTGLAEGRVVVKLHRGVRLRLEFESTARPKEAWIYYNSPVGPVSLGISTGPGSRRGNTMNLTDVEWEQGRRLVRVTAEQGWEGIDLPPKSRLDVVAVDERGYYRFRQVTTGKPETQSTVAIRWPRLVARTFLVQGEDGRPRSDARVHIIHGHGRHAIGDIGTDARGRCRVTGFRADMPYAVKTVYLGTGQMHPLALDADDSELVLTVKEPERVARRVLVLDNNGKPVPGVRVQFGVVNGLGAFALTNREGIAVARLGNRELYLVAVQWEPGVNGDMLRKGLDEDPIVYRGSLDKSRVIVDLSGNGRVRLSLTGTESSRPQTRVVHVHERGSAAMRRAVKEGEYVLEATLDGRTIRVPFATRAGRPAHVPIRFDR